MKMSNPNIYTIFRECTSRLRMGDFRLATTKEKYKELTGNYPEDPRAEVNYKHRVAFISKFFVEDRIEGGDLEEIRYTIYHELLHAKYPHLGEEKVRELSFTLGEEDPNPEHRFYTIDRIVRRKTPRWA